MARRSRYRRAIEEAEEEKILNLQRKSLNQHQSYKPKDEENSISNQNNIMSNNDAGFLSTILNFFSSIWH